MSIRPLAVGAAALLCVSALFACGGTTPVSHAMPQDGAVGNEAGVCPADLNTAMCQSGTTCDGPTGCTQCGAGLWAVESQSCICANGKWSCEAPGACIAGPGVFKDSMCTEPSVSDGGNEAGPTDGGSCEGAAPPDGSTECAGFNPGACGMTCSPEGLACSYTPTQLKGVCCGGTWSCTGI